MPFSPAERRGRRLLGGMLVAGTVAAATLVGVAAAPSYATDDYPYSGLGKCPLVPLPPTPPVKPGDPTKPGTPPGKPHGPAHPQGNPGSGQPTDPTTPTKPPAPRECAKHIWYYNGTYGDPWGFALRNCTSFVAWRLRETNGATDFSNHMDGGSWGDARHWDDNARDLGYLVDDVPAVGAVAQTDDGRIGHVAWVSAVGDGTVTVEEYNYYTPGGYDVRTVPTSDFRYLHVDDLAPAPDLGATRAAATTLDVRGLTWTARVSAAGDLTVRRPSGHESRVGAADAWSPHAAPSLVADSTGRVWASGVARDGQVLLAHTTTSSLRWSSTRALGHGGWSVTSSPTLAVDGSGRIHVFAVSATGTLVERHLLRPAGERWSLPDRRGAAGSWSPHAAPSVTTDAAGRTWVVAVTRRGSLQAQHSNGHGNRWSGFHAVDGRTWSVTSTPALASSADGRLWLLAVTARGTLVSRHTGVHPGRWHDGTALDGHWSPYSSPTMARDDAGRLWFAAVDTHGRVVVRGSGTATRWGRAHRPAPRGSVTDGPSLVALASGGIRVGVVRDDGRVTTRRLGAPGRDGFGLRRGGLSGRPPLGL